MKFFVDFGGLVYVAEISRARFAWMNDSTSLEMSICPVVFGLTMEPAGETCFKRMVGLNSSSPFEVQRPPKSSKKLFNYTKNIHIPKSKNSKESVTSPKEAPQRLPIDNESSPSSVASQPPPPAQPHPRACNARSPS